MSVFDINALVFLISSIMAILFFILAKDVVISHAENQFQTDSLEITKVLTNDIERYKELLYGASSFISTTKVINQENFIKYVTGLRLEAKYPAAQSINFSTIVKTEELDDFYNSLKQEYKKENLLNETKLFNSMNNNYQNLSKYKLHHILKYSQPLQSEYKYIGYDLTTEDLIYNSLILGMKKNNIISSGKLSLSISDKQLDKKPDAYTLNYRLMVNKNTIINQVKDINNLEEDYIGSVAIGIRLDTNLFSGINSHFPYVKFQLIDKGIKNKTESLGVIYDARYQREKLTDTWPKWLFTSKILFKKATEIEIAGRSFDLITFTEVLPPNVADFKLAYIISLGFFFLSFLLIQKWLLLEYDKERAHKIAEHMTEELKITAYEDALTKLPNRRAFMEDLSNSIKNYSEELIHLMFIDLDGFKKVNDTLGHVAGDIVLSEFGNRLKELEKNHMIRCYRIGGDEFTILIENRLQNKNDNSFLNVEEIAKNVLNLTKRPFAALTEEFYLSSSVGIAEYPTNGTSAEVLFKNSDVAMYDTKRKGKNYYSYYTKELSDNLAQRTQMENLLSHGLMKKEFYLMFQPKIEKINGVYKTIGAEVLLRWKNDKLGNVSPYEFIPIAEEIGLMSNIGKWVFEETIKLISDWQRKNVDFGKIAVNISVRQFTNINFAKQFKNILEHYSVPANKIIIEITESTMMKEAEHTHKILKELRNYGFSISIDDFGTGYSSLSYLRKLPVTEIKIDRSFTKDVLIDEQDRIVVSNIIHLAQQLNLNVVVEGVETNEQLNWFENHGKLQLQGYLFSQPISSDEFVEFIKNKIVV